MSLTLTEEVKTKIIDHLMTEVEFTNNEFEYVELHIIQEICRDPFTMGSRIYRKLSISEIIGMLWEDERWRKSKIEFYWGSKKYGVRCVTSLRLKTSA
jgi:hypothetical protein